MDLYDKAYEKGYQDGLQGRERSVPDDDSAVNYQDGYSDGAFKRKAEQTDTEWIDDALGDSLLR